MIVIDASILVPALADDGSDGRRCRARLAGEQLVAPGLIDLEVCSVVRKLALRGDLTSRRAGAAVRDLGILPLRLPEDRHPSALALEAGDRIEIDARPDKLIPRGTIPVAITRASDSIERFEARLEVETELELRVLRAGGIIPLILTEAIAAA